MKLVKYIIVTALSLAFMPSLAALHIRNCDRAIELANTSTHLEFAMRGAK